MPSEILKIFGIPTGFFVICANSTASLKGGYSPGGDDGKPSATEVKTSYLLPSLNDGDLLVRWSENQVNDISHQASTFNL